MTEQTGWLTNNKKYMETKTITLSKTYPALYIQNTALVLEQEYSRVRKEGQTDEEFVADYFAEKIKETESMLASSYTELMVKATKQQIADEIKPLVEQPVEITIE